MNECLDHIYDDPSICDDCPGCLTFCRLQPLPEEEDFFCLIDALVQEINSLEAEVVRTRQVLTEYLPECWADGLRQDIFCNLSRCFSGDSELYDRYMSYYYDGIDPMDNNEKTALMLRLRDGIDETSYYHLMKNRSK